MTINCEYCQIPGSYGNLMFETNYWLIYLAPSQRYLGTCVVVLKRHCKNLRGLNSDEWDDFSRIVEKLEAALNKTFSPTLFNWSCFMNSAYRTNPPDPEVHWHLLPRYNYKARFEGLVFEDTDFGYIPRPIKRKIPDKVIKKMVNKIKENL